MSRLRSCAPGTALANACSAPSSPPRRWTLTPESRAESPVERVDIETEYEAAAVAKENAPEDEGEADAPDASTASAAVETAARLRGLAQPGATPTATTPSEGCRPSESPAYCVYTVREGDTLSHVAETFGLNRGEIPGWELLVASNKPDIVQSDDFIQPGQKLRVPIGRGVVHTIVLDETVGDVAELFDVTSAEIIAANKLADADKVAIGQVLLIPNPKRLSEAGAAGVAVGSGPGARLAALHLACDG